MMACWLTYSFVVLISSFVHDFPLLIDCSLALILFNISVDIVGLLHIFFMMAKGGSKTVSN